MPTSEFAELMRSVEACEAQAAERLFPLIYDQLRKLAALLLSREPSGQTLQPTALVHEAYLRLVGGANPESWNSRGHFFGAAALAIRRILIDNARRKRSLKRGGDFVRHELDEQMLQWPQPSEDLLALDDALHKLASVHPQAAQLVQLRYFAGLTLAEAAELLGLSTSSGERLWAFARSWLRREIERTAENF